MQTSWQQEDATKSVVAPMSLIVSAFAPVNDVSRHKTPQLSGQTGSSLFLIDLSAGKNRLGGSVLYQTQSQLGQDSPDLDDAQLLSKLFELMQGALDDELINACHDRSDGGLLATVAEMSFAGHCGVKLRAPSTDLVAWLFNEELGLVVEVSAANQAKFLDKVAESGIQQITHQIGEVTASRDFVIIHDGGQESWRCDELQAVWSKASHLMAMQRDNPAVVAQEFAQIQQPDPGMQPKINFDFSSDLIAAYQNKPKPKVAILREQGVNGQNEMAAAFMRAGFDCVDVHMQDLIEQQVDLMSFSGLVACGGFSYGDVLGAGLGWAKTILFNPVLRQQFSAFFADQGKFALGVCNGCQMLSGLRSIIPDTEQWPDFLSNESEQFEARFSQLSVGDTDNIFFQGMAGAHIPVAIAHGEGRAVFQNTAINTGQVAAQYIDNQGATTMQYPFNPNGSQQSVAAVSGAGGRVLAMMPHPERVFRSAQMSYAPAQWGENSPWMRMFYNVRLFVD
jgi:phosphoribosylformylglycinamidine synthase